MKILAEPVCADDGYVWLNVQSAAGSSNWTAGGHKTAQWVIPCPDPNKKCSKNKPTGSISATPNPNNKAITMAMLTIQMPAYQTSSPLVSMRKSVLMTCWLFAQNHLSGSVLGRIAPLAVINIIDGPKCAGGAVWWKVWGPQTGWAVENNLRACPKEGECDPWKDEQLLHSRST